MSANSDAAGDATVVALPGYPFTSTQLWRATCGAQEPYWVSAAAAAAAKLSTTYIFDSSPGPWTLVNGTGSATITGGVCRLTSANGTSPSLTTGPRAYLTHAYNRNHVTLMGRVAAWTSGSSGSYNAYLELIAAAYRLQVLVSDSGRCYALVNGSNVATGDLGEVPLDGTGWLLIRVNGNFCEWWFGTGVGTAVPTAFSLRHQATITTFLYTGIGMGIRYAAGALPATLTVDFDDLRLTQDEAIPGA